MPSTETESTLRVLPRFISARTLCVHYVPWSWLQLLATLRMSGVHTVLSSTALLSSCGRPPMASVEESVYLVLGLPLLLPPLFFPAVLSFPKSPPCLFLRCLKQGSLGFVIFASSDASGLICCRAHVFIFPLLQGVCRYAL